MVPRGTTPGSGAERRFFLARAPSDGRAQLCDDEEHHASAVLRLAAGDRLIGLDGAGGAWPLAVHRRHAKGLDLEVAGEPERESRPGEPGALLPWIELAVALPRGAAAEEMLDRLTQLGAAALTPLLAERGQRAAPASDSSRRRRWLRIAREACKQSGRLWLPALNEAQESAELCRRSVGALVVLDPLAAGGISEWVDRQAPTRGRWTTALPLVVAVGPEGGFTPSEAADLAAAGAEAVRIGPHVLRIETAAEASLAILAERLFTRSRN